MDSNSPGIISSDLSLAQLLRAAPQLAIPDMQRDYGWGDSRAAVLASGILRAYERQQHSGMQPLPMGMVYGFTSAEGYIHIVGGQQRLTTLFLLLGMLYRRTSLPEIKHLLLNPECETGLPEPRLLYQAKRHALYFMRDLVDTFFLDRNGRLSQIERSPWYCTDYDADVTVRNFISAIRGIDSVLEAKAQACPQFDFADFARFVAFELHFVYCDMGSRAQAEDLFVTVNTTGTPLTLSQNVRALFLATEGDKTAAVLKINEIEDYFWLHRQPGEISADPGMDWLLCLCAHARAYEQDFDPAAHGTLQQPFTIISRLQLDHIHALFKAFARVAECVEPLAISGDWTVDCFSLLPAMAFVRHFPNAEPGQVQDIYRFFANIARYQRPGAADVPAAIAMARTMPSPDITSLLDLRHAPSRILNPEERAKLQLLARDPSIRPQLQAAIRHGEDHPMICGRMEPIINWCRGDLAEIDAYVADIYTIWGTDIECQPGLDPVRRALLAIRSGAYPIARKAESIYSLCWHDYDWQKLYANSPGLIRQLIDRVRCHTLAEICAHFSDRASPFWAFIKHKDLLRDCRKRQLMRPCAPFIGFYDMALSANRWLVDQREIKLGQAWGPIRAYGSRCLYSDHRTLNLAIDLHFMPEQRKPFSIEILSRPDAPSRERPDLRMLADALGRWRHDRKADRFSASYASAAEAIAAMMRVVDLTQTLYEDVHP